MSRAATSSIDELVLLIHTDPRRALDLVRRGLDRDPCDAAEGAQRWWIRGLAERELGDFAAARAALEQACALAGASGIDWLIARTTIALAYEVGQGGEIARAFEMLDTARDGARDVDRARLSNQLGVLHFRQGLLDAAIADLEAARATAVELSDVSTHLRALFNLGAIEAQRGRYAAARQHLLAAIPLALDHGQLSNAAAALGNLAFVETMQGNLPQALDCFAAADDGYRRAGARIDLPRLWADHAQALTDAHLASDAEPLIDQAIALSVEIGNDLELAELLLVSAEIDLALEKPDEALTAAVDAAERFLRQGRDNWWHVAERLRLQAQARLTPEDPAVADGLIEHGQALDAGGWRSEAVGPQLLGALLHASCGRDEQAADVLRGLGSAVRRSRPSDQILLGHVLALLADHRDDRAAARRAVTGGLRVAAATQAALGALETRSYAAQHGAELITLGARLAVADHRPRELLHRIEAMRTMVWHAPLVRPPDDQAMAAQLTELRRLTAVITDPETTPKDRDEAEQLRLRLERDIRGLARRARGRRSGDRARTTTEESVAEAVTDLRHFDDRQALAYANLDGRLLAVGVDRGRCHLHDLGDVVDLAASIETCGFVLHRLNRAQGSAASREAARASLVDATSALAARLLPSAVSGTDRPLVIVPTGVLHGVPWTALGPLRNRTVSVSPSLGGWSVAVRAAVARRAGQRDAGRAPGEPAGFVAGPGLTFAEGEVTQFATAYRRATVLTGPDATAAECLRLIEASELVHLACHGAFRTDNPLFSTLSLADGPLTVYDLERVSSMPGIIVLSACSVGTSTAINGGTLLGLSSALGAFGASSVIAPLTPVSDEGVVPVMQRLHDGLAAGLTPPVALAAAAQDRDGLDPTAAAFVTIGA